ncbi:MAG TPA: GNAT family N-acetyltransferase [Candidatus Hydrogenedentes bacterium]|nr:GNAT family N-acetyltransferase [Candidatus Hydrogenedentota bacterium]
MSDSVVVRPATLRDVAGIREIHANCEDPWADATQCALWTNHRLVRRFLIDVAVVDGVIAGHAEWIVSDEPPPYGRHLYLGMIQIHRDYQRRGIGRAMVERGMLRAEDRHCPALRTVPEDEAKGFYRSCGFSPILTTESFTIEVTPKPLPAGWRRLSATPRRTVRTLPMRWGWVQGSSAHMWELCNRPVRIAGDPVRCPCAGRTDGRAYVQLIHCGTSPEALAVAWATREEPREEIVSAAMDLAHALSVRRLAVTRLKDEANPLTPYSGVQHVGTAEVWSRDVARKP